MTKSEYEQAARAAEEAGDVREWSRAIRRLCLTEYVPKQIEVSPAFMERLLADCNSDNAMLGSDALNSSDGLVFRGVPVRVREGVSG